MEDSMLNTNGYSPLPHEQGVNAAMLSDCESWGMWFGCDDCPYKETSKYCAYNEETI